MNNTTTYHFPNTLEPVPAYRHPNGGGWVAKSATVHISTYIGPTAMVYDSVYIYGHNVIIADHAQVSGWAILYDNVIISKWAHVFGFATLHNVWVYGATQIFGEACLSTHVSNEILLRNKNDIIGDQYQYID